MKKILVIIIMITIIYSPNIKADYNGTGGSGLPGSGSCTSSLKRPCAYDNAHFAMVQISLVYYDGNNWNKIGNSVFFVNNTKYKDILEARNNKVIYETNITTCNKANIGAKNNCKYNDSWFRTYYATGPNSKENSINLLEQMNVNLLDLNLPHNGEINYNSHGYRFIIEPILQFALPKTGNLQLMTVKEVFSKYGGTSNSNNWGATSTLLSTDLDDIGITAHKKVQSSDAAIIGSLRHGYGYNIINPPIGIFQSCYKYVVKSNPNELKCNNTNSYNKIKFYESFEQTDCNSGEKLENANKYGRKVKSFDSNCTFYCREEVEVQLPGNVLPAIYVGGYFEWPSFGTSINDKHQLNIVGRRVCKAEGSSCGRYTPTIDDLYKNFETGVKIKYNDKEYKFSNIDLNLKSSNGYVYTAQQYNNLTGSRYTEDYIAERKVSLKLPDNLYSYYNVSTKKYSSKKEGSDDDIIKYNHGILPVALSESLTGKKTMQLYDFKLGSEGVFNSKANDALSDYVCTYKVTKDEPSPCICPPGTENSGQDLWCKLANSGGENCPTDIEKYCNDITLDPSSLVCEDKPKFCPAPYEHISVEKCVKAGNTYQSCVNKYCTGNPPNYTCPLNKDDGSVEWMDITGCVEELLAKNISETNAIKYCKDIVCPIDPENPPDPGGNGLNIIYRTISLRNPFPSKTLNAGIAGFNLDVKGRYPGANWNSKELVKSVILNNRNLTDPQQVYYDKEPIYKIVLTPANTKAVIEYNRSQMASGGYQDFTLKCYGKNSKGQLDGSECLSEFLKDASGKFGVVKNESSCYQKKGSDFEACRD